MSQKPLEKQSLLSSWESDEKLLDKDVIDSAQNTKQQDAQVLQFNTPNGTQQVTIHGDLSSNLPIILTYPDIGITHHGCFDPFFNMVTSYESIFRYFVVMHIDPPGNHYNAEQIPSQIESFDFESLSDDIYDLISKQMKIDWKARALIAFGVGSSCTLWARLANTHPSLLRGMVLINPIADVASWKEWMFDKVLQWTEHNKTGEYLKSIFWGSLLPRYFPSLVEIEGSEELSQSFYQEFAQLNEDNVMKYFKGYLRRKEITLQDLKNIRCRTLLIVGEHSLFRESSVKFQHRMPKNQLDFMLIDNVDFLLTVSNPQVLVRPIEMFLNVLGFYHEKLARKFGKEIMALSKETE